MSRTLNVGAPHRLIGSRAMDAEDITFGFVEGVSFVDRVFRRVEGMLTQEEEDVLFNDWEVWSHATGWSDVRAKHELENSEWYRTRDECRRAHLHRVAERRYELLFV